MRLLGAIALLLLFLLLAVLFLLLLAFIITIAMVVAVHGQTAIPAPGASLPPDVQAMLSLLILVFAVAGLWVVVRVCLYPAATVAEKHIQVFSTWKLTDGNWWRIFAAFLLLLLPAIVLAALLTASQPYPALQTAFAILSAAVNAFIEAPLFCGLYAYLYKRLRMPAQPTPLREGPQPGLAGPWG